MASKTMIFMLAVAALMAAAAPIVTAQLGLVGGLLSLIRIQGTLFCTDNGNILPNASTSSSTTPAFPNAVVKLECGGEVVASATTNAFGVFSMVLDPIQYLLSSVLTNCSLAVKTPLATCNAALPSTGALFSALNSAGNTIVGLLNIINLTPSGFRFLPTN